MPNSFRKIPLLLAGITAALVLAELLLRLTGFGVVTPELSFGMNTRSALEQGRFLPDADLFWKLPVTEGPTDRAINAVHPDHPLPESDDQARVLVLGDSCSRLSVSELPYSATLQERVAADGMQVFNASVPGYTTYQGLVWLRTQLLELKPAVVVVYFGWNDHWRATGMTDRDYAASQSRSGLRLLTLVQRRPDVAPFRVPVDAYRENLQAIVGEVRGAGGRVVLVAAPHQFTSEARLRLVQTGYLNVDDDISELHGRYLDVVRSFVGEPDVAVLSADRLFDNLGRRVPLLHRDGIHLTDDAHRAMGAALAILIREGEGADGTIPPRLLSAARLAVSSAARQKEAP